MLMLRAWSSLIFCLGLLTYLYWDKLPSLDSLLRKVPVEKLNPIPPAPPAQMYRWKDDNGQLAYGTTPPAGVKAEVVSGGSVSVVPAQEIPKPEPVAEEPQQDLRQKMMDRAIDQATGGAKR